MQNFVVESIEPTVKNNQVVYTRKINYIQRNNV